MYCERHSIVNYAHVLASLGAEALRKSLLGEDDEVGGLIFRLVGSCTVNAPPTFAALRILTSSRHGWTAASCSRPRENRLKLFSPCLKPVPRHTCRAIAFSEKFMNIIMLFIVSNVAPSDP